MYLFNPDNDLALAHANANYTTPSSAKKLGEDLGVLPIWFAPDGSKVVTEYDLKGKEAYVDSINKLFGLNYSLISLSDIALFPHEPLVPWGWNLSLRKKLILSGVPEDNLPTITDIETLRGYSSRLNAVNLLRELLPLDSAFCGVSHYFTNSVDLLSFLSTYQGDRFLKMPYSGSGKGIIRIIDLITDKQTDWARKVIKNQGGVVAEPVFNKVVDFAMEFSIADGGVSFEGYSLFNTSKAGAYLGNILMPDNDIERVLSLYVDIELIYRLKGVISQKLLSYFPLYRGFLGVDMMVCEMPDGSFKIHPCVEVNLRMNMGLVAYRFYNRFVRQGSQGVYRIDYFKHQGEALSYHNEMVVKSPLVLKDGKIISGYLALNPVNELTNYISNAVISDK